MLKLLMLLGCVSGCVNKAACTDPCSDTMVFSGTVSANNVQCCPSHKLELVHNGVICRCVGR